MRGRIVFLSLLSVLVWWVGQGLPSPPLSDPGGVGRWWREAGALMAVFGLIRIGLLAGAAVWAAALVAVSVPAVGSALARAAESSRLGRPMMRLALGLSAAGATAGGCSSGGHSAPAAPVIVGLGAVPTVPAHAGATLPPVPQIRAPTRPPTAQPAAPAPVRVTAPAEGAPGRWVVRPGDDLWSIAAATVTERSGHPAPSERAVATYWLEVIQANRAWLADPNLIFPGDVVALPPTG